MKTSSAVSGLRHSRGAKQGFSLVEVTIALGVAAFALVAIFGMLPTGLNLFRNSMDTSIKAQIVQQITSDVLQSDFDRLSSQKDQIRYYNDDGDDVTLKGGASAGIYTAQIKVRAITNDDIPRDTSVPEKAALVRVEIKIARDPSHKPITELFPDPPPLEPIAGVDTYSTFVANNK